MKITIEPTEQQLTSWIDTFVPNQDLFFIEEADLAYFENEVADVLVIPRSEFMAHAVYKRLQLANSYMYWNIAERMSYVLVAPPEWIERIALQKKQHLLEVQAGSGRGLVFAAPMLPEAPADFSVERDGTALIVMQYNWWKKLPIKIKMRFLKEYAVQWDSPECHELPADAPSRLQQFANRYSDSHGSNCLSATLFAVTGHAWIAREWVHPETFSHGLHRANYRLIEKEAAPGDVVIWINHAGIVQHASFCIGNDLFFNKNGQTFFNPWKVIDGNELNREWSHLEKKVYSRR